MVGELGISIRYDGLGEAVVFEYFIEKDLDYFWCSSRGVQRYEVWSLGEAVYKNYNGIMAFSG